MKHTPRSSLYFTLATLYKLLHKEGKIITGFVIEGV